ncbi:hypothetical protein GCM10009688_12420 [Arthrobacter gandavensis]|uniref:Secreted protein n=1 Tax=Arthrobacter gandavensis TaxID=169960 RepID=A0ABP5ABK7_9MICC
MRAWSVLGLGGLCAGLLREEQFGEGVCAELVHGAGVAGSFAGFRCTGECGEHSLALLRGDDRAEAGHAIGQGLEHHTAFVLCLTVPDGDQIGEAGLAEPAGSAPEPGSGPALGCCQQVPFERSTDCEDRTGLPIACAGCIPRPILHSICPIRSGCSTVSACSLRSARPGLPEQRALVLEVQLAGLPIRRCPGAG